MGLASCAARDGRVDWTVPFLLSAGVAQAVERVLAVAFGTKYVVSSPTVGIFLYVTQAVERVLAVAFGTKYVISSPTVGIFLYVTQAVERVLAVAFGKKLCWFESHYIISSWWCVGQCIPLSRI